MQSKESFPNPTRNHPNITLNNQKDNPKSGEDEGINSGSLINNDDHSNPAIASNSPSSVSSISKENEFDDHDSNDLQFSPHSSEVKGAVNSMNSKLDEVKVLQNKNTAQHTYEKILFQNFQMKIKINIKKYLKVKPLLIMFMLKIIILKEQMQMIQRILLNKNLHYLMILKRVSWNSMIINLLQQ